MKGMVFMLRTKLIGVGAAGGKAVIKAITAGCISRENAKIINSTANDVPDDYADIFSPMQKDALGGCGKERTKAKALITNALQDGTIDLKSFLEEDDQLVIIVTSTEGGTGSGSVPMLAKYILYLGFEVHIYAFTGFDDDIRGLKNTLDFFKELKDDGISDKIALETISNKKFLETDGGNRLTAEDYANEEFTYKLKILQGLMISKATQNIDETDLFKLSVGTYNYMMIEFKIFDDKIKNEKEFNNLLNETLDETKSLETTKGVERIGVILNVSDKTLSHIDNSFKILRERYGEPEDLFRHVQKNIEETNEYICIIAAGMDMPLEAIKKTYESFKKRTESAKRDDSGFFDFLDSVNTVGMNDIASKAAKKKTTDDSGFFAELNNSAESSDKMNKF
jgi:cell division GTPase FtsZ